MRQLETVVKPCTRHAERPCAQGNQDISPSHIDQPFSIITMTWHVPTVAPLDTIISLTFIDSCFPVLDQKHSILVFTARDPFVYKPPLA